MIEIVQSKRYELRWDREDGEKCMDVELFRCYIYRFWGWMIKRRKKEEKTKE